MRMRPQTCMAVLIALGAAGPAAAGTITAWNTDNVAVPATDPAPGDTGESIIYDRDPTAPGAVTNGKIVYTPPEGVGPGIEVENGAYTFGPIGAAPTGCIRASAPTTCDGPRRSGKRFKQVATADGPIDLVFDVDPTGVQDPEGDIELGYRVFHRLINGTGAPLDGFTISLGTGVGDGFTQSTADDGLAFSEVAVFGDPQGPGRVSSSAFYPFSLFGDADDNPNFELSGFFDDTGRSGFGLDQTEDKISSTGFFGAYDDLFGGWLPQSLVPEGALWDNDGDDTTEALLMAWFDESLGLWEIRRDIDPDDPTKAITLTDSIFESTFADVLDYFGPFGSAFERDFIEDLANLNLNYAIALGDAFVGNQFTLRVQVDPIPLPAGLPLLAAALAAFGVIRRRSAS